ncbi:MAG TPA: hypothetical protein VNM67_19380 [Thermoanaerobaculia bacterium]|jgi:hypothetical protein|nr:hypothetical protein [Thermoanaerobaculia bacterium]
MEASRVYEEVIDFIAAGSSPSKVIAFRPSAVAKARVADLIAREKESRLTADEASELEHYMQLEHIMRLAKARARKYLSSTE